MALNTSAKASALAAQIHEALNQNGLTSTLTSDSTGNPQINFGTLATTNSCALIRVSENMAFSNPMKDVFGNAQAMYAPACIQVVLEERSADATNTLYLPAETVSKLMCVLASFGSRVELYLRAQGTEPQEADITGSKLIMTFDGASVKYKLGASS